MHYCFWKNQYVVNMCTSVFQNLVDTDADKRQAVALRVDGDKAVFYRVRLVGEQDTLLDNTGIHYFYRSYIQGSVDFICGNAKSLFHVINLLPLSYTHKLQHTLHTSHTSYYIHITHSLFKIIIFKSSY